MNVIQITRLGWTLIFVLGISLSGCKNRPSKQKTETSGETTPSTDQNECIPMVKGAPENRDRVMQLEGKMDGTCLKMAVTYGGGCKDHTFGIYWNGIVAKSMPPKANLFLSHNSNEDHCRSVKTENLAFDLSEMLDPASNGMDFSISAEGANSLSFSYRPE